MLEHEEQRVQQNRNNDCVVKQRCHDEVFIPVDQHSEFNHRMQRIKQLDILFRHLPQSCFIFNKVLVDHEMHICHCLILQQSSLLVVSQHRGLDVFHPFSSIKVLLA